VSLSDPITDLPSALARIAELVVIIEKQALRIAELEEKLRQNSSNSSKPPSSDGPGSKPARTPKKKSGRKPGGQPGHAKRERALLPAEQARHLTDSIPSECECCGSDQLDDDPSPHRHQVVDLPPIVPVFDECRQHARRCRRCAHITVGPLPAGMPSLGFGPGVDAMVGQLAGEQRLSKRATAEAMTEVFGVPMSTGAIIDAQARVSAALAAPVADALVHAQNQAVKNADETPWWQGTVRAYLWVCVTSLVTVFQVHLTRKAAAAKALLGRVHGVLGTDRYSGYAWWPAAQRQVCWAHLVRDFVAITERGSESRELGEALLAQAETLFDHWHGFKAGRLSRSTLRVYLRPVQREVERLLDEGRSSEHPKTAGTCEKLWQVQDALWTFAQVEGVEPTNNAGERALRFAVVWRKMSRGAKSALGNAFVARILSVHSTLRQQRRSVYEFLREACRAHRSGQAGPSLVPMAAT
jgi:transposase